MPNRYVLILCQPESVLHNISELLRKLGVAMRTSDVGVRSPRGSSSKLHKQCDTRWRTSKMGMDDLLFQRAISDWFEEGLV